MTETEIQRAVDKVMANFPFERVARIMWAERWIWAGIDRVPFENDLREATEEKIRHVLSNNDISAVASGGFVVERVRGEVECGDAADGVEVRFEIYSLDTREVWPIDD